MLRVVWLNKWGRVLYGGLTVIEARPEACTSRDSDLEGDWSRCCGWWSMSVCIASSGLLRDGFDILPVGCRSTVKRRVTRLNYIVHTQRSKGNEERTRI